MISSSAVIHPSAIVDEPCTIGDGVRVWHFAHVREEAEIGEGTSISQGCYVGRGVRIGSWCKIQNGVSVYEDVTLEDEVFCGPHCTFTNVLNPRAAVERKAEFKPTLIRRGATIGANATIVCGLTVGRWALIGAGALVNRPVPDFALMVGVPARRIGWVTIRGDTIPALEVGGSHACPVDGSVYTLQSEGSLLLSSTEPPLKGSS